MTTECFLFRLSGGYDSVIEARPTRGAGLVSTN